MEGMMYPVPFSSAEQVVQIAKHAEALGYDSVWGNDHMTTPKYVREKFPTPPNFWEPLITYAFIAAQTSTIKFGTGILVLAMRRDIVVLAKQLAVLDQMSHGRLILGVGVGAYREEFESLHPSWDAKRGEVLEESVCALRELFSKRVASRKSEYFEYDNVEMYPKPVQDPLPIYFGGNNANAVRRAATLGQGWLGAAMSTDQARQSIHNLKEIAIQSGRCPEDIEPAIQLTCYISKTREAAVNRFRQSQMFEHLLSLSSSTLKDQQGLEPESCNLIGTVDEVADKIRKLEEAGVKHICGTYFCADTVQELLDQMEIFAKEVVPQIKEP
jgi:probable F420-dependent oxidoreductase